MRPRNYMLYRYRILFPDISHRSIVMNSHLWYSGLNCSERIWLGEVWHDEFCHRPLSTADGNLGTATPFRMFAAKYESDFVT